MNQAALLVTTAQRMVTEGLNRGSAGNLSVRCQEGFLITPTGIPADEFDADDMVLMQLDGSHQGQRKPSSEWRFHRDIYLAHAKAGAVLHAHSPFATSLACLRREIPSFHYMIALFGGDTLRCADYATFGTQALSDAAIRAMQQRNACLLANHGMLLYGRDLGEALALGVALESLCEQYWRALQAGEPVLLDAEEMQRIGEKFKHYGQQD